jgi:signal transduction histidine kinase
MSLFGRLGLRARLVLALALVAVLAVGLAALFGDLGLNSRLSESARARLHRSAGHFADVAAAVYADNGSWAAARPELRHLAELDDLRASVRTGAGVMRINGSLRGPRATAPVLVRGRRVATVTISPANGQLLTPEERHLHNSLNRLHVIAAGAAIGVALVIALLLAETLSRPLRRIRTVAERLERGDLDTRVEPGGAPELRSTARALNRLAETLEHEEELRKAGVADLAHELRTPVNGLLARIEAAQDGVLPPVENLAAMHDETLRLTRLLDDLARLGDAEQPGLLLKKQPLDLAEVAAGAATSFAPQFADAGITFTVHREPAWVSGDSGRLEQIIDNLLSNALRYTEPGGEVTLSVAQADSEAVLDVVDTGIGIAPDDLPHIFTRFWRGDRSRSRATGGTGVGLAIVRELVRAHDGRIDVDSTPGHGSRFRVTMRGGTRST